MQHWVSLAYSCMVKMLHINKISAAKIKFTDIKKKILFVTTSFIIQLELMFMKHYAPNRCLYIKVAKLRTGVGSAEMSHLQIAVSKYI